MIVRFIPEMVIDVSQKSEGRGFGPVAMPFVQPAGEPEPIVVFSELGIKRGPAESPLQSSNLLLWIIMLLSFRALPIFSMGFVLSVSPVNAAIICDGGFQIVRGEPISTPYCQDEDLAASARKNGADFGRRNPPGL